MADTIQFVRFKWIQVFCLFNPMRFQMCAFFDSMLLALTFILFRLSRPVLSTLRMFRNPFANSCSLKSCDRWKTKSPERRRLAKVANTVFALQQRWKNENYASASNENNGNMIPSHRFFLTYAKTFVHCARFGKKFLFLFVLNVQLFNLHTFWTKRLSDRNRKLIELLNRAM